MFGLCFIYQNPSYGSAGAYGAQPMQQRPQMYGGMPQYSGMMAGAQMPMNGQMPIGGQMPIAAQTPMPQAYSYAAAQPNAAMAAQAPAGAGTVNMINPSMMNAGQYNR